MQNMQYFVARGWLSNGLEELCSGRNVREGMNESTGSESRKVLLAACVHHDDEAPAAAYLRLLSATLLSRLKEGCRRGVRSRVIIVLSIHRANDVMAVQSTTTPNHQLA